MNLVCTSSEIVLRSWEKGDTYWKNLSVGITVRHHSTSHKGLWYFRQTPVWFQGSRLVKLTKKKKTAVQWPMLEMLILSNMWLQRYQHSKDGHVKILCKYGADERELTYQASYFLMHTYTPAIEVTVTRGPLILYRLPECWGYVKMSGCWGKGSLKLLNLSDLEQGQWMTLPFGTQSFNYSFSWLHIPTFISHTTIVSEKKHIVLTFYIQQHRGPNFTLPYDRSGSTQGHRLNKVGSTWELDAAY